MDNIYDLIPTLKCRVDMCESARYIIVCLHKDVPRYFFELSNNYAFLINDFFEFDFIVAYRKSGKIIMCCYDINSIKRLQE